MSSTLRILHLEDDGQDAEIVQGVLETGGIVCQVTRVETRDDFVASLEQGGFDLILADFSLPSFDGLSALRIALERCSEVPFIFVSGTLGEEVAIDALKIGATDYVLKERLSRIVSSVGRALREANENRERRKAEHELRESEQRFRDYAETASDWLWETGSDHRFTWVSKRATPGIGAAGRVGATRWEIGTDVDEEPEKWRLHMATVEAHEPFRGFTFRTVLADGSVTYIATSGKPVFDAQGGFRGYRGVSSDVTAAVRADQAEQALHQAQAELAHVARVTTLGELAASIAHEINQPLSGIITNANTCLRMLAADPPNVDGASETARRTLRDGNRASEVITRLRALLSKKDAVTDSVDLNEATREVIALSLSELQRGRVILRPELADDLPRVTGDRVQLQQVILNLLLNASDAMSGVNDRPRQLVIRTERDEGDRVRLSIQDAGAGLEPQAVDKLFEPFYTTKPGGLGMGLWISRSIIERHGGRLWAAPNDGPGATFAFSIPRTPE